MNRRGVVLVYVMILIAITAYVSSLLLNATFSRRISSEVTVRSAHATSDLSSAEAVVTNCLATTQWAGAPAGTVGIQGLSCAGAPVGCLSGNLPGAPARPFAASLCGTIPPCRVRINVCRPNPDVDPASPTCPAPGC